MCKSYEMLRPGRIRVKRPCIRLKRIYAFAAARYPDASSPAATKFWRGIMDACVGHEIHEEIDPLFTAMCDQVWKRYGPP